MEKIKEIMENESITVTLKFLNWIESGEGYFEALYNSNFEVFKLEKVKRQS